MMFGQTLPHTSRMVPVEETIIVSDNLPTYLDWRNYKGGNWITPVKRQFMCGSCYAFGSVGTMESLVRLYYDDPTLSVDLSEQYVVSCGPFGSRDGYKYGGCAGNFIDIALDFIADSGVPDEGCFPYQQFQWIGSEDPCSNACSDIDSRIHNFSYSFITGEGFHLMDPWNDEVFIPSPESIKTILVNKPVATGMLLNPIDWAFYTGGIYEPTPGPIVGHYVQVIGYDDTQQCWICKNSQSTNWGETADFKPFTPGSGNGGYFRVKYVTSEETATYFGMFTIDVNYEGGSPILTSTTTTVSCPSIEIYGEGSEELENLRHFRDNVLSQSKEGKELIKLYYQWSPLALKTMREDEEFREELKEMIEAILPMVKRAIN